MVESPRSPVRPGGQTILSYSPTAPVTRSRAGLVISSPTSSRATSTVLPSSGHRLAIIANAGRKPFAPVFVLSLGGGRPAKEQVPVFHESSHHRSRLRTLPAVAPPSRISRDAVSTNHRAHRIACATVLRPTHGKSVSPRVTARFGGMKTNTPPICTHKPATPETRIDGELGELGELGVHSSGIP